MKYSPITSHHLLVALALIWAAGCGDPNASKTTPKPGGTTAAGTATPLEESLTRWRAGDHAGAVQRFLEIDWKSQAAPFTAGTPLSLREQDIVRMSSADRERVMAEVLAELQNLKQLAAAVGDRGTATAATDPAFSRRCYTQLNDCATALNQPQAMKILQLTAQALHKRAAAGATQSGK
jgi:hypothetical protein